jgi:hypothetical protein
VGNRNRVRVRVRVGIRVGTRIRVHARVRVGVGVGVGGMNTPATTWTICRSTPEPAKTTFTPATTRQGQTTRHDHRATPLEARHFTGR